jgi:hypothetical protein
MLPRAHRGTPPRYLIRPPSPALGRSPYGDPFIPALSGLLTSQADGSVAVLPSASSPYAGDDGALINVAYGYTNEVRLVPGVDYQLLTGVQVPDGAVLSGGPESRLIPQAGIVSPVVTLTGSNARAHGFQCYGGSGTTTNNPLVDAISLAPGSLRWWVEDILVLNMNGFVCSTVPTGATHGTIRAIKASNNRGGISIHAASLQPVQVALDDIDMQAMNGAEGLTLLNVTDVLAGRVNIGMTTGSSFPAVRLQGQCQTCLFDSLDIGGPNTAGVAALLMQSSGGNSPSEIGFNNSVFQQAGVGVQINDSSQRLRFTGCMAKHNQTDGWQFNGTGAAIGLDICAANTNNQSAGTAYDVNVTSTAHVGLFGFAYASTATTAARNLASAGNNVSDVNSTNPGGLGTAGFAPGGW